MYKILITSKNFGDKSHKNNNMFLDKGYEIVNNPYYGKVPTEKNLLDIIEDIDAILIGNDKINKKIIEKAKKLKVIAKFGIGVDNIDIEAASKSGVAVVNAPGTNDNAVADLTIGLMIFISRKLAYSYLKIRQGEWPLVRGSEVWSKTLGIVGLGRVGRSLAIRAKGFNMKILACEKYPDMNFVKENNIELTCLNNILENSDYVTLHIPKTKETCNLITKKELEIMKPSAYLINAARGGLVNEDDLYDALVAGVISGAALDVMEQEPPLKKHKLFELDNFLATSHAGGNSFEAIEKTAIIAANNIISVLEGEKCENIVNTDLLI